jgi:hypothetical protein
MKTITPFSLKNGTLNSKKNIIVPFQACIYLTSYFKRLDAFSIKKEKLNLFIFHLMC